MIVFMEKARYAPDSQFNATFAQHLVNRQRVARYDLKTHARKLAGQPVDHRENQSLRQGLACSNLQVSCRRIVQKLDLFYTLFQFLECPTGTVEKGAARWCWLHAFAAAVKQ